MSTLYEEVDALVATATGLTLDDYGVSADTLDQFSEAPEFLADCIIHRADRPAFAAAMWGDDAKDVPVDMLETFYDEYCDMVCPLHAYVDMIHGARANDAEPDERAFLSAMLALYKEGTIVAKAERNAVGEIMWAPAEQVGEDDALMAGAEVIAFFDAAFAALDSLKEG